MIKRPSAIFKAAILAAKRVSNPQVLRTREYQRPKRFSSQAKPVSNPKLAAPQTK